MKICWKKCSTYEEAKNFTGVIYLHERDGKPFYWGICNKSIFGGNKRRIDNKLINPRYGSSYRHWIEGCLRHGASLYVGKPIDCGNHDLKDIELSLIAQFPSKMNPEEDPHKIISKIEHIGDRPSSIPDGL